MGMAGGKVKQQKALFAKGVTDIETMSTDIGVMSVEKIFLRGNETFGRDHFRAAWDESGAVRLDDWIVWRSEESRRYLQATL
jgi:hypothetical protein